MTTHEFVVKKDDVDLMRYACDSADLKYQVVKNAKTKKTVFNVKVKGYQDVFRLGYFFRQEVENRLLLDAFGQVSFKKN